MRDELPLDDPASAEVALLLLGIGRSEPVPGLGPPPAELSLRYLIAIGGPAPQARRWAEALAFDALERSDLELAPLAALDALPPLWRELGVAPRPALIVTTQLRRARVVPQAPRVTQPLQLETAPLVRIHGVVEGPGGVPVAAARVEIAALGRATTTDALGRFVLAGVPAGIPARLRVRARGAEIHAEIHPGIATGDADDAVVIRLELETNSTGTE